MEGYGAMRLARCRTGGGHGVARGIAGVLVAVAACSAAAGPVFAAEGLDGRTLSPVWGLPFAGVLLSIALFPLLAPHFWEHHQGKIAAVWAALVLVPLALAQGPALATEALLHTALLEYVPFILLLFALFTVAGGIYIRGNIHGAPVANTLLLAIGAVLASFIGTTGASMVMIRPLLRANDNRRMNVHVVVFFIFIVSNVGGALTPLGDPPLFLGFLRGVDFFWTTTALLVPTVLTLGALLALFFLLDTYFYRKEAIKRPLPDPTPDTGIAVRGLVNLLLIGIIIGAILMSASVNMGRIVVGGIPLDVQNIVRDAIMVVVALASLRLTPPEFRAANGFSWGPIVEVAKLFAAIFICLIPVIAMLRAAEAGPFAPLIRLVANPDGSPNNFAYFWTTGVLSSVLDNAPTYLVFFEMAGGDPARLMGPLAGTLAAISLGAVFMGANTYVGNAPNFMVYAIAKGAGVRMPSFFGYMLWSGVILIPLFVVLSLLRF